MKLPRLRFLIPFALAIFMSLGANSYVSTQFDEDQRIAEITWEAACRLSQYECPDKSPMVRRSPIIGEMARARGAYWFAAQVVWLDSPLGGSQQYLTTLHEQIHYLQWFNRVGDETGWSDLMKCIQEREALEYTNAYALELGLSEQWMRSVPEWRRLYGCTPPKQSKKLMGH